MRSPSRSASASRLSTTVGEALADRDPVGRRVERAAAPGRRERLRLAEAEVGERVLDRVDAAGEHHVARARLQLARRARPTARERRGAGGVDGVVGAAEVEPVGDPPGGDVHQEARRSESSVHSGSAVDQLARCSCAAVVAEQRRQRRADGVADGEVGAAAAGAEDHRRALAGERARPRSRRRAGRPAAHEQRRAAGTARSTRSEFGGMPKRDRVEARRRR